jgi:photosystem I P700 chlorophyll a apoprotein A2
MVGAFAHGAIFFVPDYDPELNKGNVLARMLEHKAIISISHLLSFILRFSSYIGLYIHNIIALHLEPETNFI